MVSKGFTHAKKAVTLKKILHTNDVHFIHSSISNICFSIDRGIIRSLFQIKEQVEARNELESYAYSLKNQIGDKEKLGGKLSEDEKKTIESAVDDAISWLEGHKEASVEDLQQQKKDLEGIVQPIVSKLYEGAGGEEEEGHGGDDKDEL